MHGARERNTIRWDARRALLDAEVARLEHELSKSGIDAEWRAALSRDLDTAKRRRQQLGPAPRPKMG